MKTFKPGVSPPLTFDTGEHLMAIPPVNKTVMEGETVNFACVTKDSNYVVTWYRDGVEISNLEVQSNLFYNMYLTA